MSDLRKELTDAEIAEIRSKLKPEGVGFEMSVDGNIAEAMRNSDPEIATIDRDFLADLRDDFENRLIELVSYINLEEWDESD